MEHSIYPVNRLDMSFSRIELGLASTLINEKCQKQKLPILVKTRKIEKALKSTRPSDSFLAMG